MKHNAAINRRTFLQRSAAGAAGVAASGMLPARAASAQDDDAWGEGIAINPNIDNLRVIYVQDDAMMDSNAAIIQNMDASASALAQLEQPQDAWAAIFRKPDSKSWDQVKAAIKVNCINGSYVANTTIISKVCDELHNLGVPYGNIVLYDANTPATAFYSGGRRPELPEGILIQNTLGGKVPVVNPGGFVYSGRTCEADLVNGIVDILVNIAGNKGHDDADNTGGFTLCLKNHYGTYNPLHIYGYLIGINKSRAIIGGNPARQQLNIVDSLVGGIGGPGGAPTHQLNTIVMGTFAPAVDYLTVRKIREAIMGAPAVEDRLNGLITNFGFSDDERRDLTEKTPEENNGRGWVDALGWEPTPVFRAAGQQDRRGGRFLIRFGVPGGRLREMVELSIPAACGEALVSIHDLKGREVWRSLITTGAAGERELRWGGRLLSGTVASAGTYVLGIANNQFSVYRHFVLK